MDHTIPKESWRVKAFYRRRVHQTRNWSIVNRLSQARYVMAERRYIEKKIIQLLYHFLVEIITMYILRKSPSVGYALLAFSQVQVSKISLRKINCACNMYLESAHPNFHYSWLIIININRIRDARSSRFTKPARCAILFYAFISAVTHFLRNTFQKFSLTATSSFADLRITCGPRERGREFFDPFPVLTRLIGERLCRLSFRSAAYARVISPTLDSAGKTRT